MNVVRDRIDRCLCIRKSGSRVYLVISRREATRPHTRRVRQACQTKHRHCVETSFEHLLPRAFGRDPCHRENDRGVDVAHGVVTRIGQASSPVGSVDSPQRTDRESQREAPGIVNDVVSVSVSRGVSVVATAGRVSGRFIGRRARGSPGSLRLESSRPGRPGGCPGLYPILKSRWLRNVLVIGDAGRRRQVSIQRDPGRGLVVGGKSAGCGFPKVD